MKPFSLLVPGVFLALDLQLSTLSAGQIDLSGPAGSRAFGIGVAVLPNGNFVVIDYNYDLPNALDVGAVYLYDGGTLGLISTLTGSTAGDEVGSAGITVLGNGNFVVRSPSWHNGGGFNAGAVTWGSATSGVAGVVSPANSLVGSANSDQSNGSIVVLNNGNYVVIAANWDNGPIANAGAVTWGSGTSGTTGVVSSVNSLVGSTANDQVGAEVIALKNGNYVVRSSAWDNGPTAAVGAVTWGNGTNGVTGVITSVNSLVGSTVNDTVGSGGVTALENGSYVVKSPNWDNGLLTNAGAITWSSGTVGRTGTVSLANSLVGTTLNDQASALIVALNNGNYVVGCPNWDNGVATNAGAVTWGNGTTGTTGIISSANSLVGTTVNDVLGGMITALADGNYVVSSSGWDSGSVSNAGAVTWGNGTSGVTGVVSSAISLIGTVANDFVGLSGVTALSNGMYVAISPFWDNGAVTEAGAVTWCSAGGRTGVVSAANSLVGGVASNQVGSAGITVLNNGNYVVKSPLWESGAVTNIGAVTWCNGTSGRTGVVSAVNSLIGSSANDSIGNSGVTALNNGNYVVNSFSWRNSGLANAGAVTWGNGTSGVTGVVSSANSLVGSTTNDFVGSPISIALNNGNYVVNSPSWDNGPVANVGAVTWCNGTTGRIGVISPATSLVGSKAQDQVGDFGITAVSNGNYVVYNANWDYGSVLNSGAITLGNGALGTTGEVSGATSILGIAEFPTMGVGAFMVVTYDNFNARVVVGRFKDNRVSLLGYLPEIVVERPPNVNVADGSTVIFGAPQGTNSSLLFTIKNFNVEQLIGLGIVIDGTDAGSFAVTINPTAPVGQFGATTFTVKFAPATTGTKTAALHITSNDADENPFDINLSGQVLTPVLDTDGDGLSDTTEFYLSALGFDWQVSQPGLINALFGNANGAGLYTMNQLQALNVNSPLLQKNPTNGLFTLTIGVRKSTDLINFSPFPMTAPQTTINGQGALEFQFSSTNNAAFFRLESK